MNNILFLWQDAVADIAAQGPSPLFWPFMLVALAIFYFFMIRPQQKEQKAQKSFAEELKKGSKVITIGGMHGTITDIKETEVSILIAPKTIVTLQRSSISLELTKSVYASSKKVAKQPAKEKA
jgi:preprotein translocase subunit YajC